VDGTTGNDNMDFYPGQSAGTGIILGFMDQNNATGNGPFQMTELDYSGTFPLNNDLDVNFFNPGGTDNVTYHGDDRNSTFNIGTGEAGGSEVRDTVGGVTLQRLEVFSVASVTVIGGGGVNTFVFSSPAGPAAVNFAVFGSGSANDTLTFNAAASLPIVVDLPGTITQNANRVLNFSGIGLVTIAASGNTALTVNGTAGNDALSFAQTSATAGAFSNNAQAPLFSYTGVTGALTVNGGTGTDSLSIFGTEAANTVTVNATSVSIFSPITLGTGLEQLSISTFGGDDSITVTAAPMPLTINAGEGNDTFTITPSANFPITLIGGNPAPPLSPGDTLNVNTAGTTTPTVNATLGAEGYQGSITFGNRQPILFQQMETLNPAVAPASASLQFALGQTQVSEGDGLAIVAVTRSGNTSTAVSVDFGTSADTAVAGTDYTTTNGTLNFAAGETSKTISVPITDDTIDEPSRIFRVTLSNPVGGAVLGSPFQTSVVIIDNDPTPSPTPGTFGNIATRIHVELGQNVLIGGFIIRGNAPEKVIVRGLGPSLTALGVPGALADPTLELYGQGGILVAQNDDWKTGPNMAEIQAAGLAPSDDKEAALLAVLPPGSYTVIVRGAGNTSGVGIVEAYDLNQAPDSNFANISTRGVVETGDNIMIVGFIIRPGATLNNVALRGIGPSLAQSGVTQFLADPMLDLRDSNGNSIASSDDWMENPIQALELTAHGLAEGDSREAGIFVSLPPGAYTVLLRGKNNGVGIGLVEAYDIRE
jgi:hypothetical protein